MADRPRLRLVHDVPEPSVVTGAAAEALLDWRRIAMELAALAAGIVRDPNQDAPVFAYRDVARELLDGYLEVYERWEIHE